MVGCVKNSLRNITLRLNSSADSLVSVRTEHLLFAAVVAAVVVAAPVVRAGHAQAVASARSVLQRGGDRQVVVEKVTPAGHAEHRVRRHATETVVHKLLMVLLLLMLLLLLVVVVRERERAPDSAAFEFEFGRSRDSSRRIGVARRRADLLK